jgi:hypothetical protein
MIYILYLISMCKGGAFSELRNLQVFGEGYAFLMSSDVFCHNLVLYAATAFTTCSSGEIRLVFSRIFKSRLVPCTPW